MAPCPAPPQPLYLLVLALALSLLPLVRLVPTLWYFSSFLLFQARAPGLGQEREALSPFGLCLLICERARPGTSSERAWRERALGFHKGGVS